MRHRCDLRPRNAPLGIWWLPATLGIWLLAALLCAAAPAGAQGLPQAAGSEVAAPKAEAPLRVGVYVNPPFVMHSQQDGYTGMAIELWDSLASRLGVKFAYQPYNTIGLLLDAVADGSADVGVSDVTITSARLQRIDFTQPWYDSGLRLMVNADRSTGFAQLWTSLRQSGHLRVYAWIGVLIVVASILLTIFDRVTDPEYPHQWHRGVAESFYAVMSVVTSGKAPRKPMWGALGRVLAALWMVCGVAVVAYITSSVTSVMTANTLSNQVNSAADLPGKTVGVLAGSVGEGWARQAALNTQSFDTIDQAVGALVARQIQAIIGDAAILEYYDHSHPALPVTEVGAVFMPAKYGFPLTRDSTLTRQLSTALLQAGESGQLDRLRAKYFGTSP